MKSGGLWMCLVNHCHQPTAGHIMLPKVPGFSFEAVKVKRPATSRTDQFRPTSSGLVVMETKDLQRQWVQFEAETFDLQNMMRSETNAT